MMNDKQATGKWGEFEAIKFLKEKGLEIIEANWVFLHLEIDIIAKDEGKLVIVEVKTRSSAEYGEPETFVTRSKQKKLIRAANLYMQHKNLDLEVRFDVVGILRCGELVEKTYVKEAFTSIG